MAYLNSRPRTPEVCPVCGEEVRRGALACPECGADHNSGWKAGADLDGLDLPEADGEFDYESFVQEEFGPKVVPGGMHPLWWITALLVLLAFIGLAISVWY